MLNQLIEERNRWFLWSPVLLGVGVAIYFSLIWQPGLEWIGLSVLVSCPIFIAWVRQQPHIFLLILVILFVSVGFNAANIRQHYVDAPVLPKKTITGLSGQIISKSAGNKKTRLVISSLSFERNSLPDLSKIRITVRKNTSHIHPGQRVSLTAVLLPPPSPAYPGAYDFQRNSYFQQIGAVGYAISSIDVIRDTDSNWFDLSRVSAILRDVINRHVANVAPTDTSGFSTAIMSGDKGAMDKRQLENMRQSGLAHILAISGLHMGMVGGLIFFSVRLFASLWPRLALNYPVKKWAAIIALLGLSGYLLVSGMSVSAVRAYLMISLVFIAILFDRTAISLRNLAFAAILILLVLPESLTTASFQMSFGAVFCLIAVYEKFGNGLMILANTGGFVRRAFFYLTGIVFTSLIASIATAPFSIYHFGQFSSLGILANLVAVPVMGLWVMPWTLVSFVVLPFSQTGIPLEIAGAGIIVILKIADFVANLPGAFLNIGTYPTGFLIGIVFSVLWLLIWRNKLRWGSVIIILITIPFFWIETRPDILFSDSGNLFLIRKTTGELVVSSLRADRFERKRWALLYGSENLKKISKSSSKNSEIRCDPMGCVYNREGLIIAFSNNWMATELDCERADIILSSVPVQGRCVKPTLIKDKFDLWRSGTHALYFDEKGEIRVDSVNSVRGNRPWVPLKYRESLSKEP
ncbi:MAG: ComEC family competence protein [Sneathiella sp.]|nr:ComEC family competence protein [Sneathiella sp.]